MKHCILVKFIKEYDWKSEIDRIKNIFDSINIDGIIGTEYILNCIDRENRYDLLIRIEMKKEALEKYDMSDYHRIWKEKYSKFIDKKAIFDYE